MLEPELLPLELPEPMPLPGDVVGDVVVLPLPPAAAPEPDDLLK